MMALDPRAVALGASQSITASGTSSAFTFSSGVSMIRVMASAACNIRVGSGTPTAVTTDTALAPNVVEYFQIAPGSKLAVVGTGTINVTEIG